MVSFALPSGIQAVALVLMFLVGFVAGALAFKDRKKIEADIKNDMPGLALRILNLETAGRGLVQAVDSRDLGSWSRNQGC